MEEVLKSTTSLRSTFIKGLSSCSTAIPTKERQSSFCSWTMTTVLFGSATILKYLAASLSFPLSLSPSPVFSLFSSLSFPPLLLLSFLCKVFAIYANKFRDLIAFRAELNLPMQDGKITSLHRYEIVKIPIHFYSRKLSPLTNLKSNVS